MDIETLRQEREEKRRQRRERIRRILEDDGTTPSRSSRLEKSEAGKESPRSQRSSAARRARDKTASASPTNETANESISGSARNSGDSKISPRTAEDDGSTLSSLKAKRDARRRRNREHDLKQNNMKEETRDLDSPKSSSAKHQFDVKDKRSEIKEERTTVPERPLTERSARVDRKHDTRRGLREETTKDTSTSEAGVKQNNDRQNSDANSDSTSSKNIGYGLGESVEKVKGTTMEDEKQNGSEKTQDKERTSHILSDIGTDISPKNENFGDYGVEVAGKVKTLDTEKEGEDQIKEVDDVEEVADVVGAADEKRDEGESVDVVKDVGEKAKVDGIKEDETESDGKVGVTRDNVDRCEDIKELSFGENLEEKRSETKDQEKGTTMEAVNLDKVGGEKSDELEKVESHDVLISSDKEILGTAVSVEDLLSEPSKKIAPFETSNETQEAEGESVVALESNQVESELPKEEALCNVDDSDGMSNSSLGDRVKQDSSRESAGDLTKAKPSANISNEVGDLASLPKVSHEPQINSDLSSEKASRRTSSTSPKKTVGETTTTIAEEPAMSAAKPSRSARVGVPKGSDDSWQKSARKKKTIVDRDRLVELRVLGKTGKIRDKLKLCETREADSSDPLKGEAKRGARKQKSLDEDTEKELRELSRRRDLKSRVKECDEKDRESAEAYKREVKKDARKHKSLGEDTESELKELSKVSALKSRIKECEVKDKESAEAYKREVKKDARKHKSLGEDTESELKELSKASALKSRIKECEVKDKESAEAYKKEVKKDAKKQKSLDEDTESELKELSKANALKSRIKECEVKDKESAEAYKREVKKDAKKQKSLDEDTKSELKELSKASALKSRIKECEVKDKESAEAYKREMKKDAKKQKSLDEDTESELKELSKASALKSRIKELEKIDKETAEASKREVKNDVREKKSLDEDTESELKELSNLGDLKSQIIKSCEERDKESAESSTKRIRSGERTKSFDETQEEELKQLSMSVDVETRIQSRIKENEKPNETPKPTDPSEEDELKDINLKAKLDAYKQESEKLGQSDRKKPDNTEDAGRISLTARDTQGETSGENSLSCDAAEKSNEKRGSDVMGETTSAVNRTQETNGDTERPNKEDTRRGTTSPTKEDDKDDVLGERPPPAKGDHKDDAHGGRTSPVKRDTSGRDTSTKHDKRGTKDRVPPPAKRDAKGRLSASKDKSKLDSKLESLRSKTKTMNKRDSLDKLSKTVSIKDKIAACKERDAKAPRELPAQKPPPKAAKPAGTAGGTRSEAGDVIPVNHMGDQFVSIEEETKDASIKDALSFWKEPGAERKSEETEIPDEPQEEEVVDVDIKGKMSYWESPKRSDEETTSDESPANNHERPPVVSLGNELKQGWRKRSRKLNAGEFIKELLNAKCKRRELSDIHDLKSDTKKYLEVKRDEGGVGKSGAKQNGDLVEESVEEENKKNSETAMVKGSTVSIPDDFSLDDVVNPNEVKQLRGFSDFRRQVRPTNRRAAKSNPVRKLQQRKDLKTENDFFREDLDEEDSPLKPTSVGRLGRPIEPGDRKFQMINTFAKDALAGLSAKEDVSKISLKKTSKSKTGVSKEKREYDGTAPVMLMQIKGHRHMQTRLVEPSVESLNSGDAFLLVTEKYLYVWLGKDANVMKKSKASELSNKILQYKLLNCNASVVTIIKDGNVNIETGLMRFFWNLLGGKKSVKNGKEVPNDRDYENGVVSSNTIFTVDTSGESATLEKHSEVCGKLPSIKMLDSDKAFVFDFGTEVYLWLGRTCDKATRTQAVDLAQEVFKGKFKAKNPLNPITPNAPSEGDGKSVELKRPSWAVFGRMTERAETILFEQKFSDWPDHSTKVKLDKQKDLLNKNLSSGYAKRKAKMEPVEVQLVELVPFDGAKMAEEPPPVKMLLEGADVGRGRGSYDEVERRGLAITTNAVTVYHSSDKEYRQLEEKEWGHFYSAESYVIRWSYSVKASGIRSLKGGDSKHETIGRDQIAYFFWHGRDCSTSGKGTSALATIELDSDKSPQIMVDEGNESACFLNMFDGQMIVHHGKLNETKSIEEDNVLMYCVQHEDEREINLIQIEARSSNLRSRSSFVVVVIGTSVAICVWHGANTSKEKKEGALRGAKRLAVWFKGLFDVNKLDIVELEEGNEGVLFWEALAGKNDYGSLIQSEHKCDNRVRLFHFTSTEGPFVAREILDSTRGELVSPYPFRQSQLYTSSQPALFLVDAVREMYLWQGWWPVDPEESDSSATTTGSAEFRWHRDRRLAMQTIQSYADVVGRQMSKSYVVNAGLEPVEFRAFFPFWEEYPDVTRLNLENGKVDCGKSSLPQLLAKLSRDRYTLAELRVRPLPEGVDPSKMEIYLSDDEFKEVFNMNKDEFTKLPKWKKLEQRKKAGLF